MIQGAGEELGKGCLESSAPTREGLARLSSREWKEPLKVFARRGTRSARRSSKINLIEEGVWVARKVRARHGDRPEVTLATEPSAVLALSSIKPGSLGSLSSAVTFRNNTLV